MKLVIFGLTITSSWGNGHATLWRGLCKALTRAGHDVTFFERDVPYYAMNRDLVQDGCGEVILYGEWDDVRGRAQRDVRDADAVIVTSYCQDAVAAAAIAGDASRPIRVFYDLDTPVTLARLDAGEAVGYIGPRGLRDYDLVLSFTGGGALQAMRERLGAGRTAPLYGHADPELHRPGAPQPHYRAALSYLGTYAADRQPAMERLFVAPARKRRDDRFLIAGAQYPDDFPWSSNIYFVRHLPPLEHAALFSSSRLTLNLTRRSMADLGWCPSGRLFEAAACGAALLTDSWPGLEEFFAPGSEILVVGTTKDVLDALDRSDAEIAAIAAAAHESVLARHTSAHRALDLVAQIEAAAHWRVDDAPRETAEA